MAGFSSLSIASGSPILTFGFLALFVMVVVHWRNCVNVDGDVALLGLARGSQESGVNLIISAPLHHRKADRLC